MAWDRVKWHSAPCPFPQHTWLFEVLDRYSCFMFTSRFNQQKVLYIILQHTQQQTLSVWTEFLGCPVSSPSLLTMQFPGMWNGGVCFLHSCGLAASPFSQKSCKCSHFGKASFAEYLLPSPGRSLSLSPWRLMGDSAIPLGRCLLLVPLPDSALFFSSSISWVFLHFKICLARSKHSCYKKGKSTCSKIFY